MKRAACVIFAVLLAVCFIVGVSIAGNPVPKKVGLCIPEAGTDKGWNEQGRVGLEKVAQKYGFEMVLAEGLGYGDIKATLRDLAKKGCEVIITHASAFQTQAPEIAKETGVKFVTVENHTDVTPGLISDVDTKSAPGAYLAGVLAGRMTRTDVVGIVTSDECPTWNRMSAGFAQGLKSVRPDVKLLYSLIGAEAYADAAGAKRNTEDQIGLGADVIYGMGDGASFGMLQACSAKKAKDGGKAWFIDVIGDKREIDKKDVLLTSVLFDLSVVYDQIIQSVIDGNFGKQYWLTVENGGIRFMDLNKAVPKKVAEELEMARKKIASGEVEVVSIPDTAKLHKFLGK